MTERTFTYRGTLPKGTTISGSRLGPVAAFVEQCFHRGWRALTVEQDGKPVAGIERDSDGFRTTWVSEVTVTQGADGTWRDKWMRPIRVDGYLP